MKSFFKILYLILPVATMAQNGKIGVNTDTPQALLDVIDTNAANPTAKTGLLINTYKKFPTTNPTLLQNGMLINFDNSNLSNNGPAGLYFWDGEQDQWQYIYQQKTIKNNISKAIFSSKQTFSINPHTTLINTWQKTNFDKMHTPNPNYKIDHNGDIIIGRAGTYSLMFTGGIKTETPTTADATAEIGIFVNNSQNPKHLSKLALQATEHHKSCANGTLQATVQLNKGDVLNVRTRERSSSEVAYSTDYSIILTSLN